MIKEYELNKAHAEKLATLMANHPDMRAIMELVKKAEVKRHEID